MAFRNMLPVRIIPLRYRILRKSDYIKLTMRPIIDWELLEIVCYHNLPEIHLSENIYS